MIRRRAILLGLSALAPAAMLAGCAGLTVNGVRPTPASVAHDVALIAAAFVGILPRLSLPADNEARVKNAVTDLGAANQAFADADTTAAAQPLITRVGMDINAVVEAVAGFTLPPAIASKISAAQALLPIIEMAVGMIVPAGARSVSMSPSQARQVLGAPLA